MLGLVAARGEGGDDGFVHGAAADAGADGFERGELGGADGCDEGALGIGGGAAEKGPGHVAVVAGGGDAGKNVNDDEFVGAERAGAALVRVAGLVSAGGDGVGRDGARGEAGRFDGEFQSLAGERFALEDE